MTFEELTMKYESLDDDQITVAIRGEKQLVLFDDGTVWIKLVGNMDDVRLTIAVDLTPDEMDKLAEILIKGNEDARYCDRHTLLVLGQR